MHSFPGVESLFSDEPQFFNNQKYFNIIEEWWLNLVECEHFLGADVDGFVYPNILVVLFLLAMTLFRFCWHL